MLLGYNTNGFTSHSLPQALEVLADIGYRSVGITLDHYCLDPWAVDVEEQRARIAEQLARYLLVPVIETGARFLLDARRKHWPHLLEEDALARRRRVDFLCRAVDTAVSLGARVVSLWSGGAAQPPSRELDRRLAGGLLQVCDHAAERGVVIGFEPEPGMYIESMADFDRLCGEIAHPSLGLTLDLGHAHLTEASVPETIAAYAPRICNVHVEGMQRPHHEHLVPWEGDFDVRAALTALERAGYRGPATLELSRSSHDAVTIAQRAYDFLTGSQPS